MTQIETWSEMTERHKRERRELVEMLAAERITQTRAAWVLDMRLTALNNYIHRNGILWPVIRRGFRE